MQSFDLGTLPWQLDLTALRRTLKLYSACEGQVKDEKKKQRENFCVHSLQHQELDPDESDQFSLRKYPRTKRGLQMKYKILT